MERIKERDVNKYMQDTCRKYGVKFSDHATFEVIDGPTLLVFPASEVKTLGLVDRARQLFKETDGLENFIPNGSSRNLLRTGTQI